MSAQVLLGQQVIEQKLTCMLKYRIADYLFTNMVLHAICSHMRIKTCSGIMYSVFASVLIMS